MKCNLLFISALTVLSTLSLAAENSSQLRTDIIKHISVHTQSYYPAANSHSENSWQVRDRAKESVITEANSICADRGGRLINFSTPYVEKSPDSIYGSYAIYHSYIATIDTAKCEINLEKEREIQTQNLKNKRELEERESTLRLQELYRGIEFDKRKYALIDKWKKISSDENTTLNEKTVCDFIYEQRGLDSYAEECYEAAESAHLTQSSIRIALAATINNVAYAPEFITTLNGLTLSDGLSKILFYTASRHPAYGQDALEAALGKVYTVEEERKCLKQTEINYANAEFCLTEKGRKIEVMNN